MRLALFSPILLFLTAAASAASAAPLTAREWQVDGVTRRALVHVPATAARADTPLVFAFHGHGGTMASAARSFRIHELWPEALVVYLQGLPIAGRTDPKGEKAGWQNTTGLVGDRDLKCFDVVLASLRKDYRVDNRRIYSTGHSNGGGFTYLLWAARGEVFAAVAPSAAGSARNFSELKPKPAMHVAGENDELVSFANQQRTMQAVRRLNGCAATGEPWAKSGDLVGTLYPSAGGTPFVSVIHPGTHKYPAKAPALIVRFFQEHPGK